jgi:hypothetical protein
MTGKEVAKQKRKKETTNGNQFAYSDNTFLTISRVLKERLTVAAGIESEAGLFVAFCSHNPIAISPSYFDLLLIPLTRSVH